MSQPHDFLGLHQQGRVVRSLLDTELVVFGVNRQFSKNALGIFEYVSDKILTKYDYLMRLPNGQMVHDPYAFTSTFSVYDQQLFNGDIHPRIYEVMGARKCVHEKISGVKYAVWAPNAKSVSVIGTFNNWIENTYPMRRLGESGIWELFVPGVFDGVMYKYAIEGSDGYLYRKADPYAYQGEMRPNTASIICSVDTYQWGDSKWMSNRNKNWESSPMHIYEMHMGSWKQGDQGFLSYREVAPLLIDHLQTMKYTHVEFLPVMSHPFDESWGYQVTGFYGISSRYGSVEDFQYLVDSLHREGIGVILDWVPGHFPIDGHSIVHFDGTCLYEYADANKGFHPQWQTHIFDFSRQEVINFLIGSALFYIDKMHVDGLRVDAVSSMVFLDFCRKHGEWTPNELGGNKHIEAIEFLRSLNRYVHKLFPSVIMIAEESHAFPGVTDSHQGLGFDLRWNLGWMNDALTFFKADHCERKNYYHMLVHEMTYFYDEAHILPISHDEVVHGKGSLLSKMPGNECQKFSNLRVFMSYMLCHPGKKLSFMGSECAQWLEWSCKEELHWELLEMPYHLRFYRFISKLNDFYCSCAPLYEYDFDRNAFEWIDNDSADEGVLAYLRKGKGTQVICIHNLGLTVINRYFIPFKGYNNPQVVFSTDDKEFGGEGTDLDVILHEEQGFWLTLPALTTVVVCV